MLPLDGDRGVALYAGLTSSVAATNSHGVVLLGDALNDVAPRLQ